MMQHKILIKEVLEAKGLKQKWLADKLGVSEVTISNWANNKTMPSIKMLYTITELLKVEISELIK